MKKKKVFTLCVMAALTVCVIWDAILTISTKSKSKKSITIDCSKQFINSSDIYCTIDLVRIWTEKNDTKGSVYNLSLFNDSNFRLDNWTITMDIPEKTQLLNAWNCSYLITNNLLQIISPSGNKNLPPKSSITVSFILNSNNQVNFDDAVITGYTHYRIHKNPVHNILIFSFFFILTIYFLVIITHKKIQTKMNILEAQKKRDDELIEQTMKTFTNFIDAKDEYTRGHSARVAEYCKIIAQKLGYNEDFQQDMYYMGLMHDIGKMTIPDDILKKTSHLSSNEWEIIQMHTTNGAKLLQDFTIMPSIKDAVLYHHERYDGKGYMNQLKGEAIPLSARIVCVADSFDAMNTNRCYRLKYSRDRIIQELERCSGKQFDPVIAKAMIDAIKDGTIEALTEN